AWDWRAGNRRNAAFSPAVRRSCSAVTIIRSRPTCSRGGWWYPAPARFPPARAVSGPPPFTASSWIPIRSRSSSSSGTGSGRSSGAPTCSPLRAPGGRKKRMSLLLWDDAAVLQRRLEVLGLAGARRVVLHENRTVMVSQARGGTVRIHRGYVYAPDRVLRA